MGVRGAEISLTFVGTDEIRRWNAEYRDKDEATDVLSFPQVDRMDAFAQNNVEADDVPLLLGDVVLCTDRVREQAVQYGHDEAREFVYLFIHGLLHLLGYDHMDDEEKTRMRATEETAMRGLFQDMISVKDEARCTRENRNGADA
jgi:probable rRNA maturation factor